MLKIRRPLGRLIFNMGIAIPGKTVFLIETAPRSCWRKLTNIGTWLVAWPMPSHYLNQCCNIVNWTTRNTLQWDLYRHLHIFITENAFENVIRKLVAILSQPLCVAILKYFAHKTHPPQSHGKFKYSSNNHAKPWLVLLNLVTREILLNTNR